MSFVGLIPGALPLVILFQEPINLATIGVAFVLTQLFPSQSTLIWMATLF
jgi:hypothetical protein